ncbi:hypothetical protein HZY86_06600 [Aerococcaceae bacterium DSM 111020]|nr:hypothetical protein [Aerococcaceae bacterium DSM 111020]
MKKHVLILFIFLSLDLFSKVGYAEENNDNLEDDVRSETVEEHGTDSPLLTETLSKLFNDTSQNNEMLDIAWNDYQQIEEYNFLDIMDLDSHQVTTLTEIEESFENSYDDVEVYFERAETGLQVLSYTYKAEEGVLNPERMIEDWARIEFYFMEEALIYSGISTMSLEFSDENALSAEYFDALLHDEASPLELASNDNFELNGIGQMYSEGKFHCGIAFPIHYPELDNPIGAFVVASVVDDQLALATVSPAEEAFAFSYSSVIFSSLAVMVPNSIFMEADTISASLQ